MHTIPIALAALAGAALSTPLAAAAVEDPRVVSVNVRTGDEDVDPGLKEIRVEFDQAMNPRGMSWRTGAAAVPEITGQPRWESQRVCVLPVELESGTLYYLSINDRRTGGFQNLAGEPARIYEIIFSAGDGTPLTEEERAAIQEENRRSIDELSQLVSTRYSYFDHRGVDWDAHWTASRPLLEGCESKLDFALEAARVLAVFGDTHMTVEYRGLLRPTFQHFFTHNVDLRRIGSYLSEPQQHSRFVVSGWLGEGLGYVAIHTWDRRNAGEVRVALDALERVRDCAALVIDVRANSGGDEKIAQTFAGCFVEEPVEYVQAAVIDVESPSGFAPPQTRTLLPSPDHERYAGRVVVLSGPAVMSSNEAFLLMMKQVPGCTLIGETSFGSSGNPKPFTLPNGVTVALPSWKAMTMEGVVYEGRGIPPDIRVETRPEDFNAGDPVLERAIAHLEER